MRFLVVFFILSFHSALCLSQQSIHSFRVDSVTGSQQIDFSRLVGKKILIVNIGLSGPQVNQMAELERLYQLLKDSNFVIVAFPSNDFSKESKTDQQVSDWCNISGIHFMVATNSHVSGRNASSIYQWLTHKSQNGMLETEIKADFLKFLINKQGKLVGIYSSKLSPTDNILVQAIRNN